MLRIAIPVVSPAFEPPPNRLLYHEAQVELRRRRKMDGVQVNHGSLLRCLLPNGSTPSQSNILPAVFPRPPTKGPDPSPHIETVPVYPSILTAMLKKRLEPAGRIYLLLHHLDPQGRGWLSFEHARNKLTDKSSSLHVCGWRRLRPNPPPR